MSLKRTIQNIFSSKLKRSAALAFAVLLATSACTTEEPVSTAVEAALSEESDFQSTASERSDSEPSDSEDSDSEPSAPVEETTSDSTAETAAAEPAEATSDDGYDPATDPDYIHRACLADGDDLVVLDIRNNSMRTFTGALTLDDSVSALSGDIPSSLESTGAALRVTVATLGAAEADGDTSVEQQEWQAGHISLALPDGTLLTEVDCSEAIADRVAELDRLIGDNHPPRLTVPVERETARTCFANSTEIAVLDMNVAAMTFTGTLTNLDSIETFAGLVTSEQRGGVSAVLDVNSSAIGSAENGTPVVASEEWVIMEHPYALVVADRWSAELVHCDTVSDRVAQLDRLVTSHPDVPSS